MASMAAGYGPLRWLRKAALVLCCLVFTPGPLRAAPPLRLLVLGDSLTAGYGVAHHEGFQHQLALALKEAGHDVTVIDGSVSGDTSAGGLARLDWSLGPEGADAAIVELGANDGLRGLDPKGMEANLTAILDQLQARHIPVLLSGMYAPPNLGQDYERAFRAVFDKLSHRPGLLYDSFFLEGVVDIPELNQNDLEHPNPDGVQRIIARLLPLVERLLAEAPPSSPPPLVGGGGGKGAADPPPTTHPSSQ